MTFSLYECLKVVGLQRHYDRLSSAGVCLVAHLSALTMEDFPFLGITSMEDRSRLLDLVQVLKSLDVENLGYDDDSEANASINDRGYTLMSKDDGKLYKDISDEEEEEEEEEEEDVSYGGLLSVCRQLQFSKEFPEHLQKPFASPTDSVYIHSSNKTRTGKLPLTLPVQVYPVCACRGNNACTLKASDFPLNHHATDNVHPGVAHIYEPKPSAPNKREAGMQRIHVCVRKRPLTQEERRRREADVVTTSGGECVIVHQNKEALDLTHYILQHRFYFDKIFGEQCSNEEIYKKTTYPLVQHMLKGGKATCFAYGQTGAGKTHTMLGSHPTRPGLYVLAVRDIFSHLSTTRPRSSLQVYVSFFEIYCGQLYDLLDSRKRLFAREDGEKVVHISGLRYVRVASITSLIEVISQGTDERTRGVSGVNLYSSRSHALLQIQLRHSTQQTAGRMWFVDLAGSERASDTKDPNKRSRMESAEINQSLLALKECIRSLDRKQTHTPFRQSKLTQVLKDSFVGDSMTCMIANISPGHTAIEHTLNTLRYADRVKELRGQRGRRERKMVSLPKQSLSNSSTGSRKSSVGTRDKSPHQKPNQTKGFGSRSSQTGDAILCSTPKNGRYGNDGATLGRKWLKLEQITPVRGWLGTSEERQSSKKAGVRESRIIQTEDDCHHSLSERNIATEMMAERIKDEQLDLWEIDKNGSPRHSGLTFGERESEQEHRGNEGNGEETKWAELRRRIEPQGDAREETKILMAKERTVDKEREQHLRWYHQQLQEFRPPLSSASHHAFSNTLSIPPTTVFQSSSSSFSALDSFLEDVLDSDTALPQQHTVNSHAFSRRSIDEETRGDVIGISRVGRVKTGVKVEFNRSGSECKSPHKETGEAMGRKEDGKPAGMEIQGRRRVCVATQETKLTNTTTGAISTNVQCNGNLGCRVVGGASTSSVPSGGEWMKRAADASSLDSSHFILSDLKSSPQKAAAERPLSPTLERNNNCSILKEQSDTKPFETICQPSKHPVYLQVPDVLPESQSDTMDPMSILHQANQQAATVSFLRRSNSNNSKYLIDKNEKKYHLEMDRELYISLLAMPQPKSHHTTLSSSMTASPHSETSTSSAIGGNKAPENLQNCQKKQMDNHEIPLKCCSRQNASMLHNSQVFDKTTSSRLCNFRTNSQQIVAESTHGKPSASMKTSVAERLLDQGKTIPHQHFKNRHLPHEANSHVAANDQPSTCSHESNLDDSDQTWWSVSDAQWEQLKQMEALGRKEGKLLSQQPNMAFEEYVQKLGEIVEAKALCVNNLRAHLLPYLKPINASRRK